MLLLLSPDSHTPPEPPLSGLFLFDRPAGGLTFYHCARLTTRSEESNGKLSWRGLLPELTLTLPLATETSSAATKEIALAPHVAVARILDLIR